MTALTAGRDTKRKGQPGVIALVACPVKANTVIQQGSLVVADAGFAAPARTALGLKVIGKAIEKYDNSTATTGGAAGAVTAVLELGLFKFANSGAGVDLVGQTEQEKYVYLVDDQTVAKTDGNNTRSVAGRVKQIDADGSVWIEITSGPDGGGTYDIPVPTSDMSTIANGQYLAPFTLPKAGRLLSAFWVQDKPVTTAAKLSTLQPRINGVATTGGAVALTSALCTPKGAVIPGSPITALNTFNAGDTLDVQASGTTAFVEGSGMLHLLIG